MDVGFEGSEDGCDSRKVEVPGRNWREVGARRRCCAEGEEHRQLMERVRDRIHCCVVAGIVAAAEAAGSCRSAAERNPWRGIDVRTGGRRIATAEVVGAVVCCDS